VPFQALAKGVQNMRIKDGTNRLGSQAGASTAL
jgi:hypothetical protein